MTGHQDARMAGAGYAGCIIVTFTLFAAAKMAGAKMAVFPNGIKLDSRIPGVQFVRDSGHRSRESGPGRVGVLVPL